jgi:WD40 repeat protein
MLLFFTILFLQLEYCRNFIITCKNDITFLYLCIGVDFYLNFYTIEIFFTATCAKSLNFIAQSKVKDIELKGHTDSVDQLCWDPNHPDTVATAAADKSIRLWDARSK